MLREGTTSVVPLSDGHEKIALAAQGTKEHLKK